MSKGYKTAMTPAGFLVFFDPPKPGIRDTITQLDQLGVRLKIITGDNQLVAIHLAQQVGMAEQDVLTGSELREMSDAALVHRVTDVEVFAEIEPNQKDRIIRALQKAGHVVGYIGDGINDVSALHTADVGLSVDSAVDVAKEAADIVCWNRILVRWDKAFAPGAGLLPIPFNMCLWPPARTSATCLAWQAPRSFCRSYPCFRRRFYWRT